MTSLLDAVTKVLAFATKDVSSVLRQPKLVLTLIVGPFLILALFGIGYQTGQPELRAALVVSEEDVNLRDQLVDRMEDLGGDVVLEIVTSDRAAAENLIRTGVVDIAIVAPTDPYETVRNGDRARFVLLHDTLDPFEETAIELIAEATIDSANRELLATALAAGQEETVELIPLVGTARDSASLTIRALETGDTPQARAERAALARSIERLRTVVGPTDTLRSELGSELDGDGRSLGDQLDELGAQVDALDLSGSGSQDSGEEIAALREAEADLEEIERQLDDFTAIEPAVLVSPLAVDTEVVGATDIDLTAFYVPAVIALLLQHLAITFASLSLVRERTLGTQEMFTVAPVGAGTILGGKYLGYGIGGVAIAAGLSYAMIAAFDVPMLGSVGEYSLIIVLLALASLGIGFLISSVVESDVQAVNVTMIVLLLSIFFSGFFLSLDRLIPSVRAVAWLLPITHALEAMRTIMFRGGSVATTTWVALGSAAVVLFVASWLLLARRLRAT